MKKLPASNTKRLAGTLALQRLAGTFALLAAFITAHAQTLDTSGCARRMSVIFSGYNGAETL